MAQRIFVTHKKAIKDYLYKRSYKKFQKKQETYIKQRKDKLFLRRDTKGIYYQGYKTGWADIFVI